MIAIIDYGSGNIAAIAKVYKSLGIKHCIVSDAKELQMASAYILPGVGHYDTTMRQVRRSGLAEVLSDEVIKGGKPVLGICVGMQILGNSSD